MSVLGTMYGLIDHAHARGRYFVQSSPLGSGRAFDVYRVSRRGRDGNGVADKVAIFISKADAVAFCKAKNTKGRRT